MGVHNEYHPAIPLVFADQRLSANAEFVAMFGKSLYETINIPVKPPNSYVLISKSKATPLLLGGVDEYICDVTAQLDAVNVRKYPSGQGSEVDFSETLMLLRRALCGVKGYDVFLKGAKIGTVDQAMYLDEIGLTRYRDGNFDVVQMGISLSMVWR